jgi:hypothetical protein
MIDVYIVHNSLDLKDKFTNEDINSEFFIHFIDEGTLKGKKKAYKLKSLWGARLTPFACVYEGDKMIKGFWSETDNNIIQSLINYLNGSKNKETNS